MRQKTTVPGLGSSRFARRDVNRALAALGLALVEVPLVAGAARADKGITDFTWQTFAGPQLQGSYIEKYGPQAHEALFGDEEEALQKLKAGFAPDISHPCANSVGR